MTRSIQNRPALAGLTLFVPGLATSAVAYFGLHRHRAFPPLADGQPQARIVDPFPPDSDLTIWIATNPLTRKVQEIRRDPRVTLLYFSRATFEYVTVLGTAVLDTDSLHKAVHWKGEWAALYKDQNRGEDYLLLRVKPSRLEVVSARRGMHNDPKTWRPVILDVPE